MDNLRAWAEIDLDCIAHNAGLVRKMAGGNTKLIGVVKADGYGHGSIQVAKCLLNEGFYGLAVSQLDEGIELRQAGINDVPILVLGGQEPERGEELVQYDISQAIYTKNDARTYAKAAKKLGKTASVHIAIDTGMGRIGFRPDDKKTAGDILDIGKMKNIRIDGIFTHFAVADEVGYTEKIYTNEQMIKLNSLCIALLSNGLDIPLIHMANSAAIERKICSRHDAVRAGIILYGLDPSEAMKKFNPGLKPAMSLKARISTVRKLPKGSSISYGCTFTLARDSYIATVPVGYADGYSRSLGNRGKVLIHGKFAPIVGRICMDQFMADVTDIVKSGEKVLPYEEAVLIGKQGENVISADDIAELAGTINYEVVCAISRRIPRKYIRNGEVTETVNMLVKP